jgi:hypothetical protein
MNRVLGVLALIVGVAFVLLLLVGFDNILGLLRYRVTLFLLFLPVVGLFFWSIIQLIRLRGRDEPKRLSRR